MAPRYQVRPKALALAVLLLGGSAFADPPPYRVHAADGLITGGAWVSRALLSLVPVDTTNRWPREPFAFDQAVRGGLAPGAARTSDALLLASVMSPLIGAAIDGPDSSSGAALLIYAEALAINQLITATTKRLVQRPRPYLYDNAPAVAAYARSSGAGGQLSFFSGHASLAFTAAVGGSYLFALKSTSVPARATLWGLELALAAATANLRVRAGQHFYSDVVVGALVGAAVGVTVPLLHARDPGGYVPEPAEWIAMAGGLAVGLVVSQLLPFADLASPASSASARRFVAPRFSLAPLTIPSGGAGLALTGTL